MLLAILHAQPHHKPVSTYAYYGGAIMENKQKYVPDRDQKLMEQVKEVLRYYHYAYRTEQTPCNSVAEF